jgi:hypothetical protein
LRWVLTVIMPLAPLPATSAMAWAALMIIFNGCSSFRRFIVNLPPVVDGFCCGESQAYRSVASATH